MNTTKFTTAYLREKLPIFVLNGQAITVNTCGFDSTLCEITHNLLDEETSFGEIEIKEAEEENGLVDIKWELHFPESYEEAGDAWTFRYQTLIETQICNQ